MKKSISLLLILFLLVVNIGMAGSLFLPLIEHECYSKYPNKEVNYSFVKDNKPNNESSNIRYIKTFDEMCKYSSSPTKCYECITLKYYGLNETSNTQEIKSNKPVLISTIVILSIIAILLFLYDKRKYFKHKKK